MMFGDPAIQIGQRASAHRLLLGDGLFVAAQPGAVGFLVGALASGGNNPKLMFIGWNERVPGIDGFDMAAGDVAQ